MIHIYERRNRIANELFRILFLNEDCCFDEIIKQILAILIQKFFFKFEKMKKAIMRNFWIIWIWNKKWKSWNRGFYQKKNVFQILSIEIKIINSWKTIYLASKWFESIYQILFDFDFSSLNLDLFFKIMNYCIDFFDILWKHHK